MYGVPGTTQISTEAFAGPLPAEPRNYSIENPIYPLDDPEVWSEGIVAASGHRVSPTKALHLPAVYQAVTRISGDIARCPLELYLEKDATYTALVNDPLYRLTAIQPNREMDAFKFWQRVLVYRLVWANAYIFIARNALGQPAELLPLLPDRTEPKRAAGILYYETEVNGEKVLLPADRVLHLEGIGFDNLRALDLVKLMRDAWGLALGQMDFAARVYRSGGRRGGVLEIPLTMPKTSADRLEEGFRKKYEDPNAAFTTVILRENAKFHEAQMTMRDSQSIEGREESVRDVARAFNIRPGHLGIDTSGVYGNRADDTRDYLDMTLRPIMTAITAQCRVKLLPLARQADHCFWHNTDDLLQMSPKEEFEAYGAGVEKLIITSNEARGKIGYPPIDGGDELRNPNTTAAAAQAGSKEPGAGSKTKPAPKKLANDDDDEGELALAHRQLLTKTVADVVTVLGEKAARAAASGQKFVTWLDEKLPGERAALARAIEPIAACLAAASGSDAGELAHSLTRHVHGEISAGLARIAETTTEAELRAAVTHYFNRLESET